MLQFVVGIAQMVGAVVSIWLIASAGLQTPALLASAFTSVFTIISILLFGHGGRRGHVAEPRVHS